MRVRILAVLLAGCLFSFFSNVQAGSVSVKNYSFEDPYVPPVEPYADPNVTDWIELDNDSINSANTGVFVNVTGIANTDGGQLAFLGSQQGNALLQDLEAAYQVGKSYKLTVGVCVSAQYPPLDPNGLQLAFYYTSQADPNRIDVVSATTSEPNSFTSTALEDNSIYLPTVQTDDPWAGKTIGIAIRATGLMGGYWDLDNVRVTEYPLVPNFTDDTIVNFADFAAMAADWLYCDDPLTDVTGDGCVNEDDLLILMESWLDNV